MAVDVIPLDDALFSKKEMITLANATSPDNLKLRIQGVGSGQFKQ